MNRKTALDTAAQAILKDRQATHGSPERSFACIADHWNVFLKHRKPGDLKPYEVCQMLALFKNARTTANPQHADNWVDEIGYTGCGVELATEKPQPRFYIATGLENHEQHNRVRDHLQSIGFVISYDWTTHGPVYPEGLKRVEAVSQLELEGVYTADFVVLLWPGGRGTHVELGAAIATKKPVYIFSNQDGHHECGPQTCAFYHHPGVFLYKDINKMMSEIQADFDTTQK